MATTAKTIYSHITQSPDVRGGRACVDQTRVAVVDVVFWHTRGSTPQEILTHYPSLDLEQVHAALSYYYGHKDEIEAELREDESSEDNFEKTKAEFLARRGR